MMSVGRNDPCPCGSGKKYKKCCLKKDNVFKMAEFKEEKFFRTKEQLVDAILEFLYGKLTFMDTTRLKNLFKDRLDAEADHESLDVFFHFWLAHFHTFENGLRGVEWFYEEKGKQLDSGARTVLERWRTIAPRLLQAVDREENGIWVEDGFTGDRHYMPYCETLQVVAPWSSTFSLLEPLDDKWYVTGVSTWQGPEAFETTRQKINELMETTGKGYGDVVMDFYPEVLGTHLRSSALQGGDQQQTEVRNTKLLYQIIDKEELFDHLFDRDDFVVNEWDNLNGSLSWTGQWYRYEDSAAMGMVYLGEVFVQLTVKGDILEVQSWNEPKMAEIEQWLHSLSDAIELKDRKSETHQVPLTVQLASYMVRLTKEMPTYFASFAQSKVSVEDMDKKLPRFGMSLRELVQSGDKGAAELWLKQTEHANFVQVNQQHGEVEHTLDVNGMRKELGLPLSPFVTDRETRKTKVVPVETPSEKPRRNYTNEEIAILRMLEFTPETAKAFYGKDILAFFKEKTEGKSDATFRKYEMGLRIIVDYLSNHAAEGWEACDYSFWEEFLTTYYFYENFDASANQLKSVLSALKQLTKWLDGKYGLNISKDTSKAIKENEELLFDAVGFLDVHVPYLSRKYHDAALPSIQQFHQIGMTKTADGLFEVQEIKASGVSVMLMETEQKFHVALENQAVSYAHEGMLFYGTIGKGNINSWKIVGLERVYPATASPYLLSE